LVVGSTVEVRQPSISAAPTESYVIPSPRIDPVVGSSVLTGSIPAGMIGAANGDYRCSMRPVPHTLAAGPFSFPYAKVLPGELVTVTAFKPDGDYVNIYQAAPGETPCVVFYAHNYYAFNDPPGSPPNPAPHGFNVDHLRTSEAASVRAVLRRGGTTISDVSADAQSINAQFSTMPVPGDILDIYRPKTAPTPKFSVTVPPVTAKFDPAIDLAAVDAPATGSVEVQACLKYTCNAFSERGALNTPAGRTLFDFAKPGAFWDAADLTDESYVRVNWSSADFLTDLQTVAAPGDLAAPNQSFKLASKLKISALKKALKKGFKFKLNSNEAGTANIALGKLASAVKPVKVGTNTYRLKFSKAGKKQIKKLAAKGKKAKPLTVTLTSVVKDASGNASTLTKKTKIKP
jgi:hypothetical protein